MHAEDTLQTTSSTSFPQWTDQDDAESYNGRGRGQEERGPLCPEGSSPAEDRKTDRLNQFGDRQCQSDRPSKA